MSEYSSMKVIELKELLKTRGLALSGTKPELIARLEQADKQNNAKEPTQTVDGSAPQEAAAAPVEGPEPVQSGSEKQPKETEGNNNKSSSNSTTTAVFEGKSEADKTEEVIKELEKRAARAKRFGNEDDGSEAMIKRIRKFGLSAMQASNVLKPQNNSKISKSSSTEKDGAKGGVTIDEETLKKRKAKFGL